MTEPTEIFEVRLENLRNLIDQYDSRAEFCRKFDLSVDFLYQVFNGYRNLGEKAARNLERQIGLERGVLDLDPNLINVDTLSSDEIELVHYWRTMPQEQKDTLLATARAFSSQQDNHKKRA